MTGASLVVQGDALHYKQGGSVVNEQQLRDWAKRARQALEALAISVESEFGDDTTTDERQLIDEYDQGNPS